MPGGRGNARKGVSGKMTSDPAFPEPHFFPSPEIGFGGGYILTGIKGLTLKMGQIFRKSIFFLNQTGVSRRQRDT